MSKRTNTFTRFLEDIVDDTKNLVDDVIDRAKDVEEDIKDAVSDTVDDSDGAVPSASRSEIAALNTALAELTGRVNQLAELQLGAAK